MIAFLYKFFVDLWDKFFKNKSEEIKKESIDISFVQISNKKNSKLHIPIEIRKNNYGISARVLCNKSNFQFVYQTCNIADQNLICKNCHEIITKKQEEK